MSNYLTVVIKYKAGQEQPAFHADMEVLGGKLDSVMFDNALAQLEEAENKLEEIRINGDC